MLSKTIFYYRPNLLETCLASSVAIHLGILGAMSQWHSALKSPLSLKVNIPVEWVTIAPKSFPQSPTILKNLSANQGSTSAGLSSDQNDSSSTFKPGVSLSNSQDQTSQDRTLQDPASDHLSSSEGTTLESSDRSTSPSIPTTPIAPTVLENTSPNDRILMGENPDSLSVSAPNTPASTQPVSSKFSTSDRQALTIAHNTTTLTQSAKASQYGTSNAPNTGNTSDPSGTGNGTGGNSRWNGRSNGQGKNHAEGNGGNGQDSPRPPEPPRSTPAPTPKAPEVFECLSCPPPSHYPKEARFSATSGSVQVILDVDPGGTVTHATIGSSSGSSVLDQTAIDTVYTWQFTATAAGRSGIPVYVDFKLLP